MGNASETIKLLDGLKLVFFEGARMRRQSWPDLHFVSMRDNQLSILLEDGEHHPWIITAADIIGTDWQIL
jgi:hypothetical protein